MSRQVYAESEHVQDISRSDDSWLQHLRIQMPGVGYQSEVVRRRNTRTVIAHKVLPIILPSKRLKKFSQVHVSMAEIIASLHTAKVKDARTILLHQKRPITYLPWPDDQANTALRYNVQIELPGGLIEQNELPELTVKRELQEETGIQRIHAIAQLVPGYLGNDSGTHQERYGIWVALCESRQVTPSTLAEEGIEKVETMPLMDSLAYLTTSAQDGYLIEWATYLAHAMLQVAIRT